MHLDKSVDVLRAVHSSKFNHSPATTCRPSMCFSLFVDGDEKRAEECAGADL